MSGQLSEGENLFVGVSAALVEGLILQPTLYWKNARQQGLPFTLRPTLLYRGTGAALCNEMGQMGLQFSVTGKFKSAAPTPGREIVAAASGGVVSAVFATPVELVMIQQQRFGGGLLATPIRLLQEHGAMSSGLMRGLGPAVVRDAIYVCGMLGLTPVLQHQLETKQGVTSSVASMLASMIGGIAAGVLSHPFDVVKTCMQGDMVQKEFGGAFTTAALLRRQGAGRFFHGVGWRTFNITATVYVANEFCYRMRPHVKRLSAELGFRDR